MKHPLAVVWIYSLARIAVFGAIFGLLYLFGLRGLLAAAIAIILSVPLSFVLLAKPRANLAASMQRRLDLRTQRADELDARLGGEIDDTEAGSDKRPLA
jgi:predicted Kef-type K+ transport protein